LRTSSLVFTADFPTYNVGHKNVAIFVFIPRPHSFVNATHSTFGGHVKSSVTWPFDTPYVISYWWSFETQSLSPAVFEILRSKCIRVTSLTFQGHVTSSVTWPFDSPCAVSYWWSIGTKPLSL